MLAKSVRALPGTLAEGALLARQKGCASSKRSANPEIVGVLHPHFHQDLDPDAVHAGGQNVPAYDYGIVTNNRKPTS